MKKLPKHLPPVRVTLSVRADVRTHSGHVLSRGALNEIAAQLCARAYPVLAEPGLVRDDQGRDVAPVASTVGITVPESARVGTDGAMAVDVQFLRVPRVQALLGRAQGGERLGVSMSCHPGLAFEAGAPVPIHRPTVNALAFWGSAPPTTTPSTP